jgi:hypothetical protein
MMTRRTLSRLPGCDLASPSLSLARNHGEPVFRRNIFQTSEARDKFTFCADAINAATDS